MLVKTIGFVIYFILMVCDNPFNSYVGKLEPQLDI